MKQGLMLVCFALFISWLSAIAVMVHFTDLDISSENLLSAIHIGSLAGAAEIAVAAGFYGLYIFARRSTFRILLGVILLCDLIFVMVFYLTLLRGQAI